VGTGAALKSSPKAPPKPRNMGEGGGGGEREGRERREGGILAISYLLSHLPNPMRGPTG
jgi:hypothetical protein